MGYRKFKQLSNIDSIFVYVICAHSNFPYFLYSDSLSPSENHEAKACFLLYNICIKKLNNYTFSYKLRTGLEKYATSVI